MKKQLITIYITVFNEEENIQNLLCALYKQQATSFMLSEIVVIADGSTDNTVNKVKTLQKRYKNISLRHYRQNKGKLFRLNQVFANTKDAILVILDGDIFPASDMFLENLVSPLVKNSEVQLVGGHSEIIMPTNIVGKIVASSFLTWEYISTSIPHFDSIHNFSSQATAYRGSFARMLSIPKQAFEERIYIYLMAKKVSKKGFYYAKNAIYKFLPIATMQDFFLLTNRPFGRKQAIVDSLFGFSTESLLVVPLRYKLLGLRKSFTQHPFLTMTGVILNFILPKIVLLKKSNDSPLWERSASTKRRIEL